MENVDSDSYDLVVVNPDGFSRKCHGKFTREAAEKLVKFLKDFLPDHKIYFMCEISRWIEWAGSEENLQNFLNQIRTNFEDVEDFKEKVLNPFLQAQYDKNLFPNIDYNEAKNITEDYLQNPNENNSQEA